MPASDMLKEARSRDYMDEKPEEGNDPDEENRTSRIVALTDEEQKSLEGYQIKPGEQIVLETTGNLEPDGHFHVMTVRYASGSKGGGEDMASMAKEMASMINPRLQPSPS